MPIPTPSGGEEQSAFISRCMGNDVMNSEFPDQKQRSAVCYSQWRKKDEVKPMIMENKKLKFDCPFSVVTEGLEEKVDPSRVKIKGTMIKATTSRNGWTYKMDELQSAKFSGNVISVDHSDSIKDVVGEFTPTVTEDGIDYEGYVRNTPYHPGIVELARSGLLKHVSVEVIPREMKREGNEVVARGLDFTGFGIVKTPGIVDASFAIAEAFNGIIEVKNMVEEVKPVVQVDIEPLKKEIESLKEEVKALKEKPATQGIVTQDTTPKYDFKIKKEGNGKNATYFVEGGRKLNGEWIY
jgi:predicted nucleotidyltransferase